jgi:hypothetical protein
LALVVAVPLDTLQRLVLVVPRVAVVARLKVLSLWPLERTRELLALAALVGRMQHREAATGVARQLLPAKLVAAVAVVVRNTTAAKPLELVTRQQARVEQAGSSHNLAAILQQLSQAKH